jgi:integrase/recombinase XerC
MISDLPSHVDEWMTVCGHSSYSRLIATETLKRFERFARAFGITSARDVTEELARAFITARDARHRFPAVATQHQRRSVVRLAFRVYSRTDRTVIDPTLHVDLPSRSSLAVRPITSDELALVREASLSTLVETRQPSIVALSEATGTPAEIAAIRVRDLDLGARTVALPGARHALPRIGQLSTWGTQQLRRRIEAAMTEPGQLIAYHGSGVGHSGPSSVSVAINRLLTQAGLGNERDLKVGSIRACAAREVFLRSGRIEEAARALGCRSLDVAARTIAWEWQDT